MPVSLRSGRRSAVTRAPAAPTWSPLGSTSRRPCRHCACALRCASQLRQQQRPAQRPGCHLGRVGAAVSLAGCCCLAACRHIVRAPRPPAAALTRVGPPALRCARVPLCRRAPPCRAGRARPALRRKETKRARLLCKPLRGYTKAPFCIVAALFGGVALRSLPLSPASASRAAPDPLRREKGCGGSAPAAPALAAWQRGQVEPVPSGDSVCSAPAPSRARAAPRVSICSTGAPVSAIPPAPLDFTAARCQPKGKSPSSGPVTMHDGSCVWLSRGRKCKSSAISSTACRLRPSLSR